jgi:hypothetical protein
MKTLLSSSACNTGDAACLCSDSAREAVMGEINAACGAEQSERTSYNNPVSTHLLTAN